MTGVSYNRVKERKEVGRQHFPDRENEGGGVGISYYRLPNAKGSRGIQIVKGGEK